MSPKSSPRFGHRRTGLPCRNVGSGHQQRQEQLSRGPFPTALTSLVSYPPCCFSHRCISFCAELRNCALSKFLTFSPGLAKPRTPYIGLSIVFRFCTAACAQRSAQFAQFVVRSSEGIAQVVRGASDWPRRVVHSVAVGGRFTCRGRRAPSPLGFLPA